MKTSLDRGEFQNTDFAPRLMNIVFHQWFLKHGSTPRYFFLGLLAFTILYLTFMRKEEYVIFSTGSAIMGVEMLVVFSFQVLYGYVYLEIGAIVTAFLLGLLPGALIGNMVGSKDRNKLLLSEVLLLGLLVVYLVWVKHFRSEVPTPFVFWMYCVAFSFLCGFQFPVAAGLIGERNSPAAGLLAADLCGAGVGTVATGTLLIPLWGIETAVIFLILIKISSMMMTILVGKRGAGSE
jgi:spermidine synthase